MKIILSRKGFDSSWGGCPSPVLPDGTMLSMPIPTNEDNRLRYEDIRFIKVGKGLHYIMEDEMRVEKATGESHPEASWLVDVERA